MLVIGEEHYEVAESLRSSEECHFGKVDRGIWVRHVFLFASRFRLDTLRKLWANKDNADKLVLRSWLQSFVAQSDRNNRVTNARSSVPVFGIINYITHVNNDHRYRQLCP